MEAANRFIAEVYLPAHNARFAMPPEIAESAFVAADPASWPRSCASRRSAWSAATIPWPGAGCVCNCRRAALRHHYVRATVKVRQYPDGALAIFHGPRCIGRYDAKGREIGEPISSMLHPCSTPSRRGLEVSRPAPPAARRPALTASRHGGGAP